MNKTEFVGFEDFEIEKILFIGVIILLVMLSLTIIAPEKITRQGHVQNLYERCAVTCGSPETCERLADQGIWTLAMAVELCKCMNEYDDLEYCCRKLRLNCP